MYIKYCLFQYTRKSHLLNFKVVIIFFGKVDSEKIVNQVLSGVKPEKSKSSTKSDIKKSDGDKTKKVSFSIISKFLHIAFGCLIEFCVINLLRSFNNLKCTEKLTALEKSVIYHY